MQSSQTRTLWISILAALGAIFLLYSWSQEQKTALAKTFGATKRVFVASVDIAQMETIDESKLEFKELPVDFIQPDAVLEVRDVVGQVAVAPIKKGEQLLQTKLLLPGAETGLSLEISPGKRAIPIPVDDMRGVSKLLRPGDRVDVIAAVDYGKGADAHREVRTILQDVVILATGLNVVNQVPRRFELDANGKTINRVNLSASTNFPTITVEAKPEEAQELVYLLATSPGSIFLTLRHPNDRLQAPVRVTTVEDLLGKPAVLRQPAAISPSFTPPVTAPAPQPQIFQAPQQQMQQFQPRQASKMPSRLPQKKGRFEDL